MVSCLIKMLLLLAGVESSPGPTTYKAFLLLEPPSLKLHISSPCFLICSEGTLVDVTNIFKLSPWLKELVTTTADLSCSECPTVIKFCKFYF